MAGELITGDGQLEFNGYLLGDDEVTYMVSITGWDDLPSIDSSNTLKPTSHGAWVGKKLVGQRIITWTGRFAPEERSDFSALLETLKDSFTVPDGTEEYELVIRTRTRVQSVFGAVVARAIPIDYSYSYYGANVTLQFECSDPRKYDLGEHAVFISMPSDTDDGLDYPLVYPLDYGVAMLQSDLIINNLGNAPTSMILNFSGPATNPTLVNTTTGKQLGFNIVLTGSDVLTVNTRTGTVLLNGSADRLYTRDITSSPILSFYLKPGENEMHVFADEWDAGSGVEIVYRDAYL